MITLYARTTVKTDRANQMYSQPPVVQKQELSSRPRALFVPGLKSASFRRPKNS